MTRLLLPLALLGASLVGAIKDAVRFRAVVDTTNVEYGLDGIGNGQTGIFIVAPIVVTRLDPVTPNTLVVTGTLVPVGTGSDNEIEHEPVTIFTENIAITGNTTTQDVFFDFVIPDPWSDHAVSLVVTTPGGSVDTDGLIIGRNPNADEFTFKTPGVWAHEENIKANEEIEKDNASSVETPQDPSDLGEEPDFDDVEPAIENPTTKEGEPLVPGGGGDGDDPTYPTGPGKLNVTTTVVVPVTVTVCPLATPPPPPCDLEEEVNGDNYVDESYKPIHARQAIRAPAFVDAKVTFAGWNKQRQNLRLVDVTAYGIITNAAGDEVGRTHAIKTLDINGRARFRFDLEMGQSVFVYKVSARLIGKKYVVSTQLSRFGFFVPTVLNQVLTTSPWSLGAGEVKSHAIHWPRSVRNNPLIIADAYQYITDFARTKLSSTIPRVRVWSPSTEPGAFFSASDGIYINIPLDDVRSPDVMAHEYGHYIDFRGRGNRDDYAPGVSHSSCNSPDVNTALSEGFATAYGLLALDNTIIANPIYGQYTDWDAAGTTPGVNINFEVYSICGSRVLEADEGRIRAAIFDLGDRRLDVIPAADSDSAQVRAGLTRADLNIKLSPSLLFWRAIRNNPKTFTEYWGALRALLSVEGERRAWNVLEYNWATDVDRSPPAP